MVPAKLDDRESGCIDFFLFCCLLSSGLVWPTSWTILASSWAILASCWTILDPSWAILAPQSFPRVIPEAPKGFQRLPEQKMKKCEK